MYKAGLCALTVITALTAGSLTASAQRYSNEVRLPGITGMISHDAIPEGFDPVSAADSQLEEFGFPMRPDQGDTKAYASWLRAVSVPRITGTYVNTGRYHRPNQKLGPDVSNSKDNISSQKSGNWSGYAVEESKKTFDQVEGFWVVPSVNNQFSSITGYMSFWIGLDGDCKCNDLIQDGTEQQVTGGSAQYYAWVEFIPEAEIQIPSFPVSPGDVIQAYSWESVKNGVVFGNYYMANFNTNKAVSTSLQIPPNTTYSGESAEWIVERTEVGGSFTNPLPFYAYAYMDDAYVWKTGSSKAIAFKSEVNQDISMYQGTTKLSQVSEQDSDSMWFKWDNL